MPEPTMTAISGRVTCDTVQYFTSDDAVPACGTVQYITSDGVALTCGTVRYFTADDN